MKQIERAPKETIIDLVPEEPRGNLRNGIIAGVGFLIFSVSMFGYHWLMTGISEDFGTGMLVGSALSYGLLALLSRKVRAL